MTANIATCLIRDRDTHQPIHITIQARRNDLPMILEILPHTVLVNGVDIEDVKREDFVVIRQSNIVSPPTTPSKCFMRVHLSPTSRINSGSTADSTITGLSPTLKNTQHMVMLPCLVDWTTPPSTTTNTPIKREPPRIAPKPKAIKRICEEAKRAKECIEN